MPRHGRSSHGFEVVIMWSGLACRVSVTNGPWHQTSRQMEIVSHCPVVVYITCMPRHRHSSHRFEVVISLGCRVPISRRTPSVLDVASWHQTGRQMGILSHCPCECTSRITIAVWQGTITHESGLLTAHHRLRYTHGGSHHPVDCVLASPLPAGCFAIEHDNLRP